MADHHPRSCKCPGIILAQITTKQMDKIQRCEALDTVSSFNKKLQTFFIWSNLY